LKEISTKLIQSSIFSTPPKSSENNEAKPALPPKKLRPQSSKYLPTPPQSPQAKNENSRHSFPSPLPSPSTPNINNNNNYNFHHMDELKTPTEVNHTPLVPSNESEMPCNNDILNIDGVMLRKKPTEKVSEIFI
jgi:hypothetical protein